MISYHQVWLGDVAVVCAFMAGEWTLVRLMMASQSTGHTGGMAPSVGVMENHASAKGEFKIGNRLVRLGFGGFRSGDGRFKFSNMPIMLVIRKFIIFDSWFFRYEYHRFMDVG